MNTPDEANGRKSAPVETPQLFAADDTLNRELDALRQRRYRNCEPDLEYVHAEFERLCLAEIQAAIAGVIRPTTKSCTGARNNRRTAARISHKTYDPHRSAETSSGLGKN